MTSMIRAALVLLLMIWIASAIDSNRTYPECEKISRSIESGRIQGYYKMKTRKSSTDSGRDGVPISRERARSSRSLSFSQEINLKNRGVHIFISEKEFDLLLDIFSNDINYSEHDERLEEKDKLEQKIFKKIFEKIKENEKNI